MSQPSRKNKGRVVQTAAAFRVRRECSIPVGGPAQLMAAQPSPNPRVRSFTQAGEDKRAEIEVLGGEELPSFRGDSGGTDEVEIVDYGDDAVLLKKRRAVQPGFGKTWPLRRKVILLNRHHFHLKQSIKSMPIMCWPIPLSTVRIAFWLEREHICPLDRSTCKGLPHNVAQSELKLRNLVTSHTKNTEHER